VKSTGSPSRHRPPSARLRLLTPEWLRARRGISFCKKGFFQQDVEFRNYLAFERAGGLTGRPCRKPSPVSLMRRTFSWLTRPIVYVLFLFTRALTRPFGEPYALRSLAESLAEHEILGALLLSAPTAVSSKTVDLSGNSSYVDALKKAIGDVLAGKKSVDSLETAQATIDQLEGKPPPEEQ